LPAPTSGSRLLVSQVRAAERPRSRSGPFGSVSIFQASHTPNSCDCGAIATRSGSDLRSGRSTCSGGRSRREADRWTKGKRENGRALGHGRCTRSQSSQHWNTMEFPEESDLGPADAAPDPESIIEDGGPSAEADFDAPAVGDVGVAAS